MKLTIRKFYFTMPELSTHVLPPCSAMWMSKHCDCCVSDIVIL